MKVSVTNDCVACEKCVEVCPEVFRMGDEIAETIVDVVASEFEDAVRDAAQECPVEAIIVEE